MPNPILVQADDELALIQYLRTITRVTALVPGSRITTTLPSTPTNLAVIVTRAAGTMAVDYGIDDAAIQVDVIGGTKRQCKVLMLTVRAAILAIANDIVPEGVLVSASEEVGPGWIPDTLENPPIPRYVARFRVMLHP